MNNQDLRKCFREKVYPSRPNEWDVDEALADLEDLEEEQQLLLLGSIPVVWPVSHSLSFSFLKEGARNAAELDRDRISEWLRRILDNYEEGGLKKARAYMAGSDPGLLDEEVDSDAVQLSDNLGRLSSYARGISGLDLELREAAHIYTDTDTIFLPGEVDFFSTANKNLLHYRFLISLQTGFIRLGSLNLQPFCCTVGLEGEEEKRLHDGDSSIFMDFEERQCARDLYQLLELYRVVVFLQNEYPGLMRDTVTIRRKLLLLRLGNGAGRNRILESLLRAVILPEEGTGPDDPALMTLLHSWESSPHFIDILESMYRYVTKFDASPAPFTFYPFMDRFRFAEAQRVTDKRIARNKKRFTTLLADFLVKNKLVDKEKGTRREGAEQADSARIQVSEGQGETERSIAGASITINNLSIELPEEIRELISRIHADLGRLPEGYVSAAFGIAGQGRTAGESDEGRATEAAERFIPYDEWDFRRQGYRKGWCGLRQRTLQGVRSDFVPVTLVKYRFILMKIRRQFEMMRTQERFARRRRHGDDLDLDALTESLGDQYAGLPPSEKVFIRLIRNQRSIATYFLVDMSNSTEGWIGVAIKEALVLLCEAMEVVGDRYGIFGFSGMRRMRSEVYKVKDIAEAYNSEVKGRIAAIGPKEYTRMGPPIRHMISQFTRIDSKTKLLLLLSDGKPEDYDDYKGRYAIEDTRKALAEARGQGIHSYCITIDREAHEYLEYLFGRGNYAYVQNIEQLPSRLTEIYRILTR